MQNISRDNNVGTFKLGCQSIHLCKVILLCQLYYYSYIRDQKPGLTVLYSDMPVFTRNIFVDKHFRTKFHGGLTAGHHRSIRSGISVLSMYLLYLYGLKGNFVGVRLFPHAVLVIMLTRVVDCC